MQKFNVALLILVAGAFLAACGGGEKKADPVPTDEAEVVQSAERFWQFNDTNPETPADQRLECRFASVTAVDGAFKIARADVKTSGACKWDELRTAAETTDFPAENAKGLLIVTAGVEFAEADAKPKWDCATISMTTNKRTINVKDCTMGKEARDALNAQKGFSKALSGDASKNVEEATFRLNNLFF